MPKFYSNQLPGTSLALDAEQANPMRGASTGKAYSKLISLVCFLSLFVLSLGSALAQSCAIKNVIVVGSTSNIQCQGGSGVVIGLNGSGNAQHVYTLYRNNISTGITRTGTNGALNFGAQTAAGTYTVQVVRSTGGNSSCTATMNGNVLLTTPPTAFAVSGGGAYCSSGSAIAISLSGSESGVNYQLLRNGVAVGTPVAGNGSSITFPSQTIGGTYTVTGAKGGCQATMTGSAVITNNNPANFSVTGGGTISSTTTGVSVGLSGSETGTSYQLYRDGSIVGSPVAGSGSAFSFGNFSAAGVYTVIATRNGCSVAMSGNATINVQAQPSLYNVTGGGAYCTGGAGVAIGLDGSDNNISYKLMLGGSQVGSTVIGNGSAFSFGTFTAAGTYTVEASNNTVQRTMNGSATITANPGTSVYAGRDTTLLSGMVIQLGEPAEAGATYSWSPVTGLASPSTNATVTVQIDNFTSAPITTVYTVTKTNSAGCTSTDQVSVTVYPNPGVSGSATPDPVNLFDNVTLSVDVAVPGAKYYWEIAGGSIPITSAGGGQVGSGNHPKAIEGASITVPAHLVGLVPYLVFEEYGSYNSVDTVYVQVDCLPALATGTYTINNNFQTSGTNFRTIRDAAYRISHCGIAGPVNFQVSIGSGPYTQRVELSEIPGASATNTVTFDGNGATLLYNSQLNYKQAAISMDGADYVTITDLNIAFTPTSIAGWGIHLFNAADHNVISNNTITLDNTSIDTRKWAGIVATGVNNNLSFGGNNANDLQILNNTITGGVTSIRLTGTETSQLSGIVIEGNNVSNAFQNGISLSYINGPVVRNNVVSSRSSVTTSTGISVVNSPSAFTITGNKVTNVGQYGIILSYVNNTGTTERALLANNMVGGGFTNTTAASGIVLNDADNIDVVFNSVNLTGNAPGAALDVPKSYATGLDIRNNSLAYTGTGGAYALRMSLGASANQLDYNNYYSTGTAFVYYNSGARTSLAALQAVAFGPAGHDAHSKQGNPNYVSATNLHATGTQLANSGINLASVDVDFDGQTRSTSGTSADIGADEFTSPFRMAGAAANGAELTIAVSPNPVAGDFVNVAVSNAQNGQVQVQLVDMLGRVVLNEVFTTEASATVNRQISMAGLSKGMYVMSITQAGETVQTKLIKQ